jgi:hypothetical protein
MIAARRYKVGDLRPSQMLYSFGIGAIIDLPRLSGLIMGLDDWDVGYAKEIGEERLLNGVRAQEGLENVKRLLAAPTPPEGEECQEAPVCRPFALHGRLPEGASRRLPLEAVRA